MAKLRRAALSLVKQERIKKVRKSRGAFIREQNAGNSQVNSLVLYLRSGAFFANSGGTTMIRNTSVAFGVLGFAVLLGHLAIAGVPPPINAGGVTGQIAAIVDQLRAAHKLLNAADRDYSGHRARAAEEVHKAIRELTGRKHGTPMAAGIPPTRTVSAIKPSKGAKGSAREPQASSDSQLRQAQTILQGVQSELNSRHHKAAGNLKTAIAEINTALSLK